MPTISLGRIYARPDTIEEAYRQCEHLINSTVAGFIKRHGDGRDPDELMGRAHDAFVLAYNRHDPTRGNFGQRVVQVIWHILLDGRRKDSIRHAKGVVNLPNMERLPSRSKPSLEDFKEGLTTDDARTVVQLLVDLDSTASPGKNRKKLLYDALQEAGWAAARIVESFKEIGEAIMEQCPRRHKKEKTTEEALAVI